METTIGRPATPTDFHRLADQGRVNGVLLLTEGATGERFATSGTRAGTVYRLTAYSCSCPGFCHHQRCQHHSLLLAELGWLLEPDPPAPAVCGECHGRGLDPVCTGHRRRSRRPRLVRVLHLRGADTGAAGPAPDHRRRLRPRPAGRVGRAEFRTVRNIAPRDRFGGVR